MGDVTDLNKDKAEDKINLSRDDLPKDLQAELGKGKRHAAYSAVADIIAKINDQGDKATIDNIIIAYYRVHKEELKRGSLIAKLGKMREKRIIKQSDDKVYHSIVK